MELDPLTKAVREEDIDKFKELWEEADGEQALLAGVLMGGKVEDAEGYQYMLRRLLDTVDPNWRSSRDDGLLSLGIRSAVPGIGDGSTQQATLQTGDNVITRLPDCTLGSFGDIWMPGVIVDSREDTLRVHIPYSGTTNQIPPGFTSAVYDRISDMQELTPGLSVLIRVPDLSSAAEIALSSSGQHGPEARSHGTSFTKHRLPSSLVDVWVEATLSAYNNRGGYDVMLKDATVQLNRSAEDIRALGKVNTLGYEPIADSLIAIGQHVRVIEKGTGGSWKGVIKGRNASGGYEVLYPADGDFETDVPLSELFVPIDEPHGDGGGRVVVTELLKRDCLVSGSQGLQVACKRNNLQAVTAIVENTANPYLGVSLKIVETGLSVQFVDPSGPSSGILRQGDIVTKIGSVRTVDFSEPFYQPYVRPHEVATLSVLRTTGIYEEAQVTPRTNDVDHNETYLRQTAMELTRSEDIAKLLISIGGWMGACRAVSRGWYDAGVMLLNETEQNVNEIYKGSHALEIACYDGHIPMATQLLEKGADPNSSSSLGHTPLYNACCCSTYSARLRLVTILLHHGAAPHGTRSMAALLAMPVAVWRYPQHVLQNTPTGWTVSKVIQASKTTYTLLADNEITETADPVTLASWHPTCSVLYKDKPAVVQLSSIPNLTIALKTANSIIESPLWEVTDLRKDSVLLEICKMLCGDSTATDTVTPRYRPVDLTERHKGDSVFELVDSEELALYLMQTSISRGASASVLCRVHPSYAAGKGWLKVLEELRKLDNPKVDWDDVDHLGMPPVANAIVSSRIDVLQFLLNAGANADSETYDGRHFTLLAVELGDAAVDYLKLLNSSTTHKILRKRDSGALGLASKIGSAEVVSFLLENGASIKSRYGKHLSYEWACIEPSLSKESILLRLMEKSAVPNMAEVVASGYTTALQSMLEKGGSSWVNHRARSTGNTPLINACITGNIDAVQHLIEKSDVDATNDEGRCSLFAACGLSDTELGSEIVGKLLKAGAKVAASEAVPYAASLQNTKCLQLLLSENTCNPNEKFNTLTALDYSMEHPLTCSILATNTDLEVTVADLALLGSEFFDPLEVAIAHGEGIEIDDIDDDFGRTALGWVCMERCSTNLISLHPTEALYCQSNSWKPCTAILQPEGHSCRIVLSGSDENLHVPISRVVERDEYPHAFKGVSVLVCVGDEAWQPGRIVSVEGTAARVEVFGTSEIVEVGLERLNKIHNKTLFVAKLLHQHGADVNAVDSVGKSVLHLSVEVGDDETTAWIIENHGDVRSSGAVIAAVQRGSRPILELLLSRGGSLAEPWHGKYPAMVASDHHIMQMIVDTLEAIQYDVPEEAVPLVADCTRQGWGDIVKQIVQSQPELARKPGSGGVTAIEATCKRGDADILKTLLEAGTRVEESNALGETPLFTAARAGFRDCVEVLLETCHPYSTRALPVAAACGHFEIVELLFKRIEEDDTGKKRDAATETFNGRDALMTAATQTDALLLLQILQGYADDTHLLFFATSGWAEAVDALLSHENAIVTTDGLWRVSDALSRHLSLWPKLTQGVAKNTPECVVVDLQTQEKWHGTIISQRDHRGEHVFTVEYDDATEEEVFGCEIFHIDEQDADAKGRDSWWAIFRKILKFCSGRSIQYARILRIMGTSDPVLNLVQSLRVTSRHGLRLYVEGVREGLPLLFDPSFASLQQNLKKHLCVNPTEPDRLDLFMTLYRKGKGIVAESALSLACKHRWVEAVFEILRTNPKVHSEPNACHYVVNQARDAFTAASESVLAQLSEILDGLVLAGFPFRETDLLMIYKLKLGQQALVEMERSVSLPPECHQLRWTVGVQREHITLTDKGTVLQSQRDALSLGLLHIAAYHNNAACILSILDATGGHGATEFDNNAASCLPRDYTTSMECHDILLSAEQKTGRIPEIEDIDLVIGVEMGDYEIDLSAKLSKWISNLLGGKKTAEKKTRLGKVQIKRMIEELGVGAFLWEPPGGEIFIICNASVMRLEIEARRCLLAFSKKSTTTGIREFTSGARQFLVEHILNHRSGNLETWRCSSCPDAVNSVTDALCTDCGEPYESSNTTEYWLERLQADTSIQKLFGVHDATEREAVFKLWRYQPFSTILEYLLEPNQLTDDMYLPARALNSYLGSKITFYFLFAAFYMSWLLPLIVSGLFFTFFQIYNNEVDNSVTVVNGVFVILWASLCVKRWRRKSSEYSYLFRTRDHERLVTPSSEFLVKNEDLPIRRHPVTGLGEPDYTWLDRLPRQIASWLVTLLMISIVGVVMYANYLFRTYLDSDGEDWAMQIVAGVENAISVIILDALYKHVVEALCDWENHRTVHDKQQSLTAKWFGFQFVNGFSGLTLTMLTGTPRELLTQLASLLLTQAFVSVIKEKLLIAGILRLRNKRANIHTFDDDREAIMVADSQKPVGRNWLFEDYSMICLQFTYTISFASVLPSAPVFAFIASLIELQGDLYKYLYLGQRTSPEKASGIGIWLVVLDAVTLAAIPYNALAIFRQGEAWKRHTWLKELYTESTACQATAGSLSLVLALFFIKVMVSNFIESNARWVHEAELRVRFMSRNKKITAPDVHGATPTPKASDTRIITVQAAIQ